jgi:hypothetical protein
MCSTAEQEIKVDGKFLERLAGSSVLASSALLFFLFTIPGLSLYFPSLSSFFVILNPQWLSLLSLKEAARVYLYEKPFIPYFSSLISTSNI